ncbi:MAG: hypothetical protein WED13_07250 [Methyloceanibacter sp.]
MTGSLDRRAQRFWFLLVVTLFLSPPAAAQSLTHMGQLPVEHVMIENTAFGGGDPRCPAGGDGMIAGLERVRPDGQHGHFVIPPDKIFVLTDVDWTWRTEGAFCIGCEVTFEIELWGAVLHASAMHSTAFANNESIAGANVNMTSGVLVSPEAKICVMATHGFPSGHPGNLLADRHLKFHLRGYLVPAARSAAGAPGQP